MNRIIFVFAYVFTQQLYVQATQVVNMCYRARSFVDSSFADKIDREFFITVHRAQCNQETVDRVRMLLNRGAHVNVADLNGTTALMLASLQGNLELVELLLEIPQVMVNAVDNRGVTALMKAARGKNVVVVQKLIKAGADVHATDGQGRTVLMYVRDESIFELLVREGADIKAQGPYGMKVLHYAARRGSDGIVKKLLTIRIQLSLFSLGVDVNEPDNGFRWTALMFAVRHCHTSIIEALLKAGADMTIQNHNGQSAEDMVSDEDCLPMREAMQKIFAAYKKPSQQQDQPQSKPQRSRRTVPAQPDITPYEVLRLSPNASDEEILGLAPNDIKNQHVIKRAYRRCALKWHPDKWKINERYQQNDIENLSSDKKNELINDVFKLIEAAHARLENVYR